MCKFQVSLVCVEDGKDLNKKLQLEVYGNSSTIPADSLSSVEPSFTDKLASFQVLDHKSFLLNVYKASKGNDVCDGARKKHIVPPLNNQNKDEGEKIVEMLHMTKDAASSEEKTSHEDLHTKLAANFNIGQKVYHGKEGKCEKKIEEKNVDVSNYGSPLKTVIINLDDWTPNQMFDFHVNTMNEAETQDSSQVVLIPFDKVDDSDNPIVKEEKAELEENCTAPIVAEPISIQILVGHSLILAISSSLKRICAPELNNNGEISSTKALIVRNKSCNDSSEIALTDEGIPLVPTRKQIIRELIRERLRSLKMGEIDANKFLDTREHEFVQHRSLSVRLPLITRPNMMSLTVPSNEHGKEKPFSVPLSISFEFEARYQTLIHHSDNLNKIINSAAVTAIEGSIYFILPHITMTPSTKLNQVTPSLVDDWLDIIYTAAYQLKPADPYHVQDLVDREMKQVTKCSEELLKNSRKTLAKCKKLNEMVLKKYRKAKLPKMDSTEKQPGSPYPSEFGHNNNSSIKDNAVEENFPMSKADLGYSKFLQKLGVSAAKLYPNHVYIAVGKYGVLLKKSMRDSWFLFDDLNYPERRVIFLGLMEHMQETIRAIAGAIRRIDELYVDGYPANVHAHLNIVFELIRDMNKFDMGEVMKSKVLSQGQQIVNSISRLVTVVREIKIFAKMTFAKFHGAYYDPDDAQRYKVRKPDTKAARVQLIVPFSALATEGLATLKFRTEDAKDCRTTDHDHHGNNENSKEVKAEVDLPIFDKVNLF